MYNIISFLGFSLSSYFLLRIFKPPGFKEAIIYFFCFFTGHILITGYILSSLNHIRDLPYWSILSSCFFLATLLPMVFVKEFRSRILISKKNVSRIALTEMKNEFFYDLTKLEKFIVASLFLTTIVTTISNAMLVVFTAPNNWDSMTYHLARIAYYLQNNNLGYYDSNYWAQVVHLKNATILMIYSYLVSGRNENLTQIVQYASYCIAAVSVYGSARKIGGSRIQSLFAAMIFSILIEVMLEATSTQNDMVIAAYVGIAIYSLLAFRETGQWKYLIVTSLAIGISIGVKSSALIAIPAIALIGLYSAIKRNASLLQHARNICILMISTLIAVIVFSLPAGYLENKYRFDNPFGPKNIREYLSYGDKSIGYIVTNGTKNAIRFSIDFLSLDGMPDNTQIRGIQFALKAVPRTIIQSLGIDLEATTYFIYPSVKYDPFKYEKLTIPAVDSSFWGILGFGLILIVVVLAAIGIMKSWPVRVLALSSLLFFLTQSYIGPYDPWRGRYFTMCAVIAAPTVIMCIKGTKKFISYYVAIIVILGCFSAISTIIFRPDKPMVAYENKRSVFKIDRIGQMTSYRPEYYEPISRFEKLVPKDASVAVLLPFNSYEFPLFGEGLTRYLMPINSFTRGPQPVPEQADYLLFSSAIEPPLPEDEHLGIDWFVRKLK